MHLLLKILSLLVCCVLSAFAQQEPVIEGIANAASFAPSSDTGISSGAIVSIFGQNLAFSISVADTSPLPYSLAGTSVTVNGMSAPLFYVSPTQINFQVPGRLVGEGATQPVHSFPIIVRTPAGSSQGVIVNGTGDAPGIFTQDASGCGKAAVENIGSDGSVSLNSNTLSTSPGSFVSIFATGIGPVYFPPRDGTPASDNPPAFSVLPPGAKLGLPGFVQAYPHITFSGRAPGLIGVDQINVQIPDNAPEGCDVPLTLSAYVNGSQPVTLSIRRGGGPCQNPPLDQTAILHWQRTVTAGPDAITPSIKETFTGTLLEAPKNLITPLPDAAPTPGCECQPVAKPAARACPNPGIRPLNAGQLTLQGVNGSQTTVDPAAATETVYTAVLGAGSIQRGQVQATAAGSADIGAFQSSLPVPAPIEITTPLAGGTVISEHQPFRIAWTNGGPDALVRLRVTATDLSGGRRMCQCTALASDGQVVLGTIGAGSFGPLLPLGPSDGVEVAITMMPLGGAQSFFAPGLGTGKHDWSYEYLFKGLKIH